MTTTIDVRWRIRSPGRIPLQHQYHLLSAIARLIPDVHPANPLGIHPIRGIRTEPGFLDITETSALTIRTPVDQLPPLLALSGKKLDLAGCPIRLGVPHVIALAPCQRLSSHLVTIKGYKERDEFSTGVRRQLDIAHLSTSVMIKVGPRRVLRIKNQSIIGFQVNLAGLTASESLYVQQYGIGGRRHMGCGLFNAVRDACRQ